MCQALLDAGAGRHTAKMDKCHPYHRNSQYPKLDTKLSLGE